MTALAVVALWSLACLGAGAAMLTLLRVRDTLPPREWLAWSFSIGLGVLGWLLFVLATLGGLTGAALLALCLAALPGLAFLRKGFTRPEIPVLNAAGWLLLAVLGLVIAFDSVEALSPPVNMDSLGYHVALPKRFLAVNGIGDAPMSWAGGQPLLVQMNYAVALALGGERALRWSTTIMGWAPGFLLFCVARRYLNFAWSLAAALVFLTAPVVIFAGGTGQVETRSALFALIGALATAESLRGGRLGYSVLAGLAVGFFAATKYTGLLFVVAAALVLCWRRDWLRHGVLFAAAALVAGGQWYAYNWWTTGDPIFPAFFIWFDWQADGLWNRDLAAELNRVLLVDEHTLPRDPLWFLLYSFKATLDVRFHDVMRTGMGIYLILGLPFAAAAAWAYRRRLLQRHPLGIVTIIGVLYFAFYFFSGIFWHPRYLAPVFPLFILCTTAAAVRLTEGRPTRPPLIAAVVAALVLQLSAHFLFTTPFLRAVIAGEDRNATLERLVPASNIALWLNRNLDPESRVFHEVRQFNYLLEVPHFFGYKKFDAVIQVREPGLDAARFWRRLVGNDITHVVANRVREGRKIDSDAAALSKLMVELKREGCAAVIKTLETENFISRTLPTLWHTVTVVDILELRPETCQFGPRSPAGPGAPQR